MLRNVLAAFSPRGDQFVITTGDGRVKTWDVASGHLSAEFNEITAGGQSALAPTGHLGLEYKSLAWGGTTKKSKKKSIIALGTAGGDVLAWNPVLGELKWRSNDCNAGGVNSVCVVKGQEILFCAGADGMVCELDVESGNVSSKFRATKSAVTSIAVSPDGTRLLAAAGELKLFDMSTRKRKRKFSGHASPVTATAFTGDGVYALSAAVEDRHVAIWDCDGSDKGAKLVLTLEHPPVFIDTWGFGKDGKTLKVLAVSEVGEAYIWSATSVEELAKVSPVRISVGSKKGKASKQSVILGRLVGSDAAVVARGVTVKPSFETVPLPGEPGSIVLPPEQGNLLTSQPDSSTDRAGENQVTVLGADNAADASHVKAILESGDVKKRKRKSDLQEPENVSEPPQKDDPMDTTPIAEDKDEQTMEERLMALGLLNDKRFGGDAIQNLEVVPPKSDSLDVLMTQALRSNDHRLLEQCFTVVDEKVIANTIRKLTPADACTLLKLAIPRLEARPRRGLQLLAWIQAALLEHSTFIMSNHSVQRVLTTLHQVIDARLHIFRPVLALSGRLNLIMAKINASETIMQSDETQLAAVYEEDDESDEDVEDAMQDDDEEDEEDAEADATTATAGAGAAEQDDDAMQEDKRLGNGGGSFSDDDDSD